MSKKRLIIARHAKSIVAIGGSDHSRVLTAAGEEEAQRLAVRLREADWCPNTILTSDAKRARSTATLVAQTLGKIPVTTSRSLYLGGLDEIVAAIAPLDQQTIMLLGHNPGFARAVRSMTGRALHLGTAYAALIEFSTEPWSQVVASGATGTLYAIIKP